jgi:hypothetical protein
MGADFGRTAGLARSPFHARFATFSMRVLTPPVQPNPVALPSATLPRFSHTFGPRRATAGPGGPSYHPGSPAPHVAHVREGRWPFTGGTSGGTLGDKDQEIRVRTRKFTFRGQMRHNAPSGVLCKACVEKKPVILAPQVGFEPTTLRLTAEWFPRRVPGRRKRAMAAGASSLVVTCRP